MRIFRSNATLTVTVFTTLMLHGQSSPKVIRRKLTENGKPIQDAAVFLQSLDDEKCAKLFSSHKENRRSLTKLERCMHDLSTASTNADGQYQFAVARPGWYAVHFLWDLGTKPKNPQTAFVQGRWGVMYAGSKDSSGKYDTMAQDGPFYFKGEEDAVRDADLQF